MSVAAELPKGIRAWACFAVFDQGGPSGETILPLAVVFAKQPPSRKDIKRMFPKHIPEGRWTFEVEAVPVAAPKPMVKIR